MSKKQPLPLSRPITPESLSQLLYGTAASPHVNIRPQPTPINVTQTIPDDIEIIDLDSDRNESVKPWVFGSCTKIKDRFTPLKTP